MKKIICLFLLLCMLSGTAQAGTWSWHSDFIDRIFELLYRDALSQPHNK